MENADFDFLNVRCTKWSVNHVSKWSVCRVSGNAQMIKCEGCDHKMIGHLVKIRSTASTASLNAVGSTGLNMQKRCRRVHLIGSAHSLGFLRQAFGRVRRLGDPWDVVYLYEYCVENTFDDRTVHRNIEKVVPEAMAVMQNRIANVLF